MRLLFLSGALIVSALLGGCGSPSPRPPAESVAQAPRSTGAPGSEESTGRGSEIVIYAMSLLDTGYRFGGKNPEAGLDCSGMVSYIFRQAAGLDVRGSAADIARGGRPVDRAELRPGDLVFFNTRNHPYSHVGIYVGDNRFVHAPSTNGKVRVDSLGDRYYARRYEAARSYLR